MLSAPHLGGTVVPRPIIATTACVADQTNEHELWQFGIPSDLDGSLDRTG